jgi:hypothetical protein
MQSKITRRAVLAGAPAVAAVAAFPVQAAEQDPVLDLWRQFVDAESWANEREITDDERAKRTDQADAVGALVVAAPALTMAGLVAKLRFADFWLDPSDGPAYRAIVTALADAERLGGAS